MGPIGQEIKYRRRKVFSKMSTDFHFNGISTASQRHFNGISTDLVLFRQVKEMGRLFGAHEEAEDQGHALHRNETTDRELRSRGLG